jgi:hypothetical protein
MRVPQDCNAQRREASDAMRFLRFACNLAARFLAALIREGFLN